MKEDRPRPSCFSRLDIVFPKGEDGLRHSPEACMACILKTECLRAALTESTGAEVKSEMLDRAYRSGLVGFWGRWARKKGLARKKQRLT